MFSTSKLLKPKLSIHISIYWFAKARTLNGFNQKLTLAMCFSYFILLIHCLWNHCSYRMYVYTIKCCLFECISFTKLMIIVMFIADCTHIHILCYDYYDSIRYVCVWQTLLFSYRRKRYTLVCVCVCVTSGNKRNMLN